MPSTYRATGVHHGYRRVSLVKAGRLLGTAGPWRFVLDEFAPVWDAWLSWLDPGGFIVPHRDAGPWWERWQIPVAAQGDFRQSETFAPTDGVPFRVEHWRPHAVVNDTDRPRVHLVLDRAVRLDYPPASFALYPIPDDMADLVERSLRG